jgi:hypothetical protein
MTCVCWRGLPTNSDRHRKIRERETAVRLCDGDFLPAEAQAVSLLNLANKLRGGLSRREEG